MIWLCFGGPTLACPDIRLYVPRSRAPESVRVRACVSKRTRAGQRAQALEESYSKIQLRGRPFQVRGRYHGSQGTDCYAYVVHFYFCIDIWMYCIAICDIQSKDAFRVMVREVQILICMCTEYVHILYSTLTYNHVNKHALFLYITPQHTSMHVCSCARSSAGAVQQIQTGWKHQTHSR